MQSRQNSGKLLQAINESGRWQSSVDIKDVGVSVAWATVYRVIERQTVVYSEVPPLVKVDRRQVGRQYVKVDSFAIVMFSGRQVGEKIVQQKRSNAMSSKVFKNSKAQNVRDHGIQWIMRGQNTNILSITSTPWLNFANNKADNTGINGSGQGIEPRTRGDICKPALRIFDWEPFSTEPFDFADVLWTEEPQLDQSLNDERFSL